jgi:hypothetical protein
MCQKRVRYFNTSSLLSGGGGTHPAFDKAKKLMKVWTKDGNDGAMD